jgi:hypothetical protein
MYADIRARSSGRNFAEFDQRVCKSVGVLLKNTSFYLYFLVFTKRDFLNACICQLRNIKKVFNICQLKCNYQWPMLVLQQCRMRRGFFQMESNYLLIIFNPKHCTFISICCWRTTLHVLCLVYSRWILIQRLLELV